MAHTKKYYEKHHQEILEHSKRYYQEHKKESKERDKKTRTKRAKKYNTEIKIKVFKDLLAMYGERCICCGESNPRFLTLDHIQNDGYLERSTNPLNRWRTALKKYDPVRYQILCYNCNCGKERNGGICPHKQDIL